MTRALLIVNPRSRRGAGAAEDAARALTAAGLDVLRRDTGRHLPALIRAVAGEVDCAVVGGGDGTLNAAAPGLLATGLPLGILPLGTANDLARTLGLPLDLEQAAAVIARGRTRRIDLGEVNGVPFFNVASIGLGVDLARALRADSKRRFGVLGYAIAGARVLRRLRPFHATIIVGGEAVLVRTLQIAVGNGRHFGGGMTVCEDAAIDDGRLDVTSLEVEGIWGLLKLLPALRSGRHARMNDVRTLAGQEMEVRTRRPRGVNTDGEITTRTPARFVVRPGAVKVFVPEA